MAEDLSPPQQSSAATTAVVPAASGGLAEAAAAHLERSGHTDEGFGRGTEEIDKQAACLIEFARARNIILPDSYTSALKKHGMTSAEHEVYYREADNRAVKRTYSGMFGVTPDRKGDQTAATPLFYFRRIILFNSVFHSDIKVEGIIVGGRSLLIGVKGEQASVVTSQPWVRAANPNHVEPSEHEIEEFLLGFKFEKLPGSYFGWFRREDNITILDARPDNFIRSQEGVVPIDLVISQRRESGTLLVGGEQARVVKMIVPP